MTRFDTIFDEEMIASFSKLIAQFEQVFENSCSKIRYYHENHVLIFIPKIVPNDHMCLLSMRFESSLYTSSETNDNVINNESQNFQKKLLSQVSGINKLSTWVG